MNLPSGSCCLFVFALLGVLSSCGLPGVSADRATGQSNGGFTGGLQLAGTAVRSTAFAVVRQPLSTSRLGARMLAYRAEELVRGNLPFPVTARPRTTGAPGSEAFSHSLTALGLPRPALGTVELMLDGDEFFSGLENEIRNASEFIDIQIYIWDNDDIGARFADLLRQRAEEIPVRVMIDDLGSTAAATIAPLTPAPPGFKPPRDIINYLRRDSPLRARRVPNPWLVLDHTKLLIFDGKSAILGGMNIGREYRSEWHDLMVRVRGPIVDELRPEFEKKWRTSGPFGDFARLRGRTLPRSKQRVQAPPRGSYPIRLLRTKPTESRTEILDAMLEAIRASRERVWIENPYLTSDRILDSLLEARRRGVDVRAILPGRQVGTIMDLANISSARDLIRAGAKVYRYPGMTHMKVMICDGWATVGAANLDTNSLQINHELNISYWDRAAVERLATRVFRKDFELSQELTLDDTQILLAPIAPIVESLADQL